MAELVPSQSEQDYLKAIYHLTHGEAKERTGPAALAEWLGFSCPSATNMVKKLAERGLVTHSPYHGVALTAMGEKVALEVLRHHRLLETYLSERLGVPWEQVHAEADRLEHALSEDLEARLDAALGYPDDRSARRADPDQRGRHRRPRDAAALACRARQHRHRRGSSGRGRGAAHLSRRPRPRSPARPLMCWRRRPSTARCISASAETNTPSVRR